jgi:predicted small secreted protein
MNTSAKRLLLLLLALGATAFAITGCQTTKGFGRDVEHLGGDIQGK